MTIIDGCSQPLAQLAARYGVRRLDIFGSAVNGRFDSESSDLDFLVDFIDDPPGGMAHAYFGLLEDLEALFDRPVDVVTRRSIKNPYFMQRVEETRRPVYVA